MSLTSLSLLKQFLGKKLSNTANDPQLTALMDAADLVVKNYCRREFESKTYTEFYAGTDRRELILRQTPVTSITNVWQDFYGSFGDSPGTPFSSSTLLTFGTDYDVDWDGDYPVGSGTRVSYNGCLLRINSIWQMRSRAYYPLQLTPESQSSDGTIKVTYTAGYSPVPMDVQYAVAWVVAYMLRTVPLGGELEGEKIGDYSYYMYHPRHMMPQEIGHAREILAKYRELVI